MDGKKLALIIAGSSGIGVDVVKEFCANGYDVAFTYNSNKKLAQEIEASTDNQATAYQLDVSSEDSVKNLMQELDSKYHRLDALVYMAGIFEDSRCESMELSSWNKVLATNLTGAFLVTKYSIDALNKSSHGRIIYTGSVMGESGCYGSCSYSATKAGLIGLAKSVGLENASKGLTANVVSFGYIDAGMTHKLPENVRTAAEKKIPMKRLGDSADTAKVIVSLCDDCTNYISGQVIRVNGMLYV